MTVAPIQPEACADASLASPSVPSDANRRQGGADPISGGDLACVTRSDRHLGAGAGEFQRGLPAEPAIRPSDDLARAHQAGAGWLLIASAGSK